jgi:hypothetical protein
MEWGVVVVVVMVVVGGCGEKGRSQVQQQERAIRKNSGSRSEVSGHAVMCTTATARAAGNEEEKHIMI